MVVKNVLQQLTVCNARKVYHGQWKLESNVHMTVITLVLMDKKVFTNVTQVLLLKIRHQLLVPWVGNTTVSH